MLEIELKFKVTSFNEIRSKLKALGCTPGEPVEETNLILDLPGTPLRFKDIVFRLRNDAKGTLLTIKKPIPCSLLKVRNEIKTVLDCTIDDAAILFGHLGYGVVLTYEKIRRECTLKNAQVCLDELWFGRFIEIEATSDEDLLEAAELLGLDVSDGIRLSYPALETEAREDAKREDQ